MSNLTIGLPDATRNVHIHETFNGKQNVLMYARKSRIYAVETKPGILNRIYRFAINLLIKCKIFTSDKTHVESLVKRSTEQLLKSPIKSTIFKNLEKTDRDTLDAIETKRKEAEKAKEKADQDAAEAKAKAERDMEDIQAEIDKKNSELAERREEVIQEGLKVDDLAKQYLDFDKGLQDLKEELSKLNPPSFQEFLKEVFNPYLEKPRFVHIMRHRAQQLYIEIEELKNRNKEQEGCIVSLQLENERQKNEIEALKAPPVEVNQEVREPDQPFHGQLFPDPDDEDEEWQLLQQLQYEQDLNPRQ